MHGTNILVRLSFLEVGDRVLGDVYRQETFDHIPILNIFLSLLNFHGDLMNHVLLLRGLLKHGLELELAVLELLECGPILG